MGSCGGHGCPCFNLGHCCWSGFGPGYRRFASPKNELALLEDEEKALEEQLKMLREEKTALQSK